jgi:hypothetical protein
MNHVVLGDCLDPEHGLPSLPDDSVDHVVADPPYEAHAHENRRRVVKGSPGRIFEQSRQAMGAVDVGFDAMTDDARVRCAEQLARVTRGWVLVFSEDAAIGKWVDALVAAGAKRRTTCMWVKRNAAPGFSGEGPSQGFEAIVTAWAGPTRSRWNGGGRPGL